MAEDTDTDVVEIDKAGDTASMNPAVAELGAKLDKVISLLSQAIGPADEEDSDEEDGEEDDDEENPDDVEECNGKGDGTDEGPAPGTGAPATKPKTKAGEPTSPNDASVSDAPQTTGPPSSIKPPKKPAKQNTKPTVAPKFPKPAAATIARPGAPADTSTTMPPNMKGMSEEDKIKAVTKIAVEKALLDYQNLNAPVVKRSVATGNTQGVGSEIKKGLTNYSLAEMHKMPWSQVHEMAAEYEGAE